MGHILQLPPIEMLIGILAMPILVAACGAILTTELLDIINSQRSLWTKRYRQAYHLLI